MLILLLSLIAAQVAAQPPHLLADAVEGPLLSDWVAQFGSSVFLGGDWDWLPYNSSGRSRCTDMVDRIAEVNPYSLAVQFIPTFYWWDSGPRQLPRSTDLGAFCAKSNLGGYYCYNRFNATRVLHWCYRREGGSCPPVNASQIESFVRHVGACMQHATAKGFSLSLNVRVDDGRALGGWRNTLDFDPLHRYGGFSYLQAILYPLGDAVARAMTARTRVDFTIQGEMGATAFLHPYEWVAAGQLLKARVLAAVPRGWQRNIRIGIGMNNNKLCGCINIGITDAREYLGNFSAAFDRVKSDFDLAGIRHMFGAADYVGLSAYVPMTHPRFEVCELEGLMERFDQELAYYNLSLAELQGEGVAIQWIEFGVGGGSSPNGDRRATTAEEAAYFPFWGVWGEYSCTTDPWQLCHPERPSPVRQYSRYFYNQTAAYLLQGGCNYQVEAAYLWNLQSWDVQGVYPLSTNPNGSYRDPEVIATINAHNALAAVLNHASRLSLPAAEAVAPPAPVPTRNPLLDDTLTTGPPRPAESSQPSVLLLDPTDDAGDPD